ncbi:MAG: hypothetical protein U0271_00520 [Polyangiaceae bacterium]
MLSLSRRARTRSLAALAAFAATATLSSAALAEWRVGFEPKAEFLFGDDFLAGPGFSFDLGYSLDTYPVLIVPEVELSAAVFPMSNLVVGARGTAGIRVGLTLEVEPSVYLHVGYGLLDEPDRSRRNLSNNFTIDTGVSLDKRIDRSITLGGSLGYEGFIGESSEHGFTGSVHLGLWL